MKYFLTAIASLIFTVAFPQTKPGTSFYEKPAKDLSVCPESLGALTDGDVENLLKEMLESFSLKMSYIVVSCPQIDNCQAIIHKGKPYILYNAAFLDEVKRLNFSEKELPVSDKNWKALTILAHELGHHLNNHLSNPLPGMSNIDLEIGADQTAGFIIYTMGGSIAQAQLAFKDVPEAEGYTHPGRQKRLDAIAKGWNDAFIRFSKGKMTTAEANLKADDLYKSGDYAGALRYYRLAAEQGSAVGQYHLGLMYYKNFPTEIIVKDLTEALKWFRKSADQGYDLAQLQLGFMDEEGIGVSKNLQEAKKWYTKGAEQKQLGSQIRLAAILKSEGNYAEAMKWFRKAADQGSDGAQTAIGILYSNGEGVTKNFAEAFNWFLKAALQGNIFAQNSLGNFYFQGDGVAKNHTESFFWYRKSAEQGNDYGQENLGNMYRWGYGISKSYSDAVYWYRKAADQGNKNCQFNLGYMYENGEGLIKDITEAVKWYRLAAAQNHAEAQNRLKKLGYSY